MDPEIIIKSFDDVAAKFKNSTAVEDGNELHSYRKLYDDYRHVANVLHQAFRLQKGEPVAVYLPPSYHYTSAILGINLAGGMFMPLETKFPGQRLVSLIETATPRVFITVSQLKDELQKLLGTTTLRDKPELLEIDILLKTDKAFQESRENTALPAISGNDSNYLIYTSGSTGAPKIIEGRHKGLTHFIQWEVNEFRIQSDVRVAQLASTSFDVSLRDIFVPLTSGGTLCIPPDRIKQNIHDLLEFLISRKITLLHIVPSLFRLLSKELALSESTRVRLVHLKLILLAGEPSYGKDVNLWYSLMGHQVELVNLYGPSETTLAKVFYRIPFKQFSDEELIPLGRPISNTTVAILNAENRLCANGMIGEICIRTPFRSKGYFHADELSESKFIQNPLHNNFPDIIYRTGDMGKYDGPENLIYFIGRKDDQHKIAGNRVELGDINAQVLKFKGINQSLIVPIKKPDNETVLACYFTGEEHINDTGQLRKFLEERLPAFMLPSYYVALQQFPLTINGKIDRRNLPPPEDLIYEAKALSPPKTPIEIRLAELIKETLGISKVGMNYSFSELGGHSIAATRIISRIFKEFGKNLSIKLFLQSFTIGEIAAYIESEKPVAFKPIGKNKLTGNIVPLSADQRRIWLMSQFKGASSAYNIPTIHRVKFPINRRAMEEALRYLINSYEILRSSISVKSGEPVQKIHLSKDVDFKISYENLDGASAERIDSITGNESAKPFPLDQAPLFRVSVFSLSENEHLIVIVFHHLICDGWSLSFFKTRFINLYHSLVAGHVPTQKILPIQYKDFVSWEREQIEANEAELKQFWKTQFDGYRPIINRKTRNHERNWAAARLEYTFPADKTASIVQYAGEHSVTPFALILSTIYLLIYKSENQQDITIGIPVSLRDHSDLHEQIGTFLNTIPVRMKIDPQWTSSQMVVELARKLVTIYQYKFYPFEKIIDQISPFPDNDLFDIMVVWEVKLESETSVVNADDSISSVTAKFSVSKHDLIFTFSLNRELNLHVDYNTSRFDEFAIRLLLEKLKTTIDQVIGPAEIKVSDIDLYKNLEFISN